MIAHYLHGKIIALVGIILLTIKSILPGFIKVAGVLLLCIITFQVLSWFLGRISNLFWIGISKISSNPNA